jgi:hypothetical protein
MKNTQSSTPVFQLKGTHMAVSAVLIGAGSLMGLAGLITGGTAMFSATRRWFRELAIPPAEVTKHKWGQARSVASGAQTWQGNGTPAHSGRV